MNVSLVAVDVEEVSAHRHRVRRRRRMLPSLVWRKLLLLMNKLISMMILGFFTESTFSLVESLSHLILAPLFSYRLQRVVVNRYNCQCLAT